MKIAYVGNFIPSWSTENHIARTLESMGHFVQRIQENGIYATQTEWLSPDQVFARSKVCDLFLFTRTSGKSVTEGVLSELRGVDVPSVSYHLDLYIGLERDGGISYDPFWRTDYVFTPDGGHIREFKKLGINHYYMKPGVFGEECYIADKSPSKRDWHEVVFAGNYNYHKEWPYRPLLIDWLKATYGNRFVLFGNQGLRVIRGHELNVIYASSKIIVGDSLCLGFKHPYYWSDRVYETLGRGGFIIHPYIKGLEDEFTDGKNIVFYEYANFPQLKEKIDYYLTHEKERIKIRDAGHQFVKENCTYKNRLEQMLKIVEGKNVV